VVQGDKGKAWRCLERKPKSRKHVKKKGEGLTTTKAWFKQAKWYLGKAIAFPNEPELKGRDLRVMLQAGLIHGEKSRKSWRPSVLIKFEA